ncbi:MAG TPA: tetratricopeptide repeat protein [Candidatus Aquicultor sp.]|jgi:tetratricopeptide (TPR) repeat protein
MPSHRLQHKNKKRLSTSSTIGIVLIAVILVITAVAYYYLKPQAAKERADKPVPVAISATQKDNSSFNRHIQLGLWHSLVYRYDEAIHEFEQALAINPHDESTLVYAGVTAVNKNDTDTAMRYLNQAIGENKSKATASKDTWLKEAYYYRGLMQRKSKQPGMALSDFNSALAIQKNNVDAYVEIGYVHLDTADYDNAIQAFATAVSLDPKCADAFNGLGAAYDKKGNKTLAQQNYRTAIELKTTIGKTSTESAN